MIVGVFCRANHPAGYGGFPDVPPDALAGLRADFERVYGARGEQHSGAHGYVTLIVSCATPTELEAVETRLKFWFQWAAREDLWYGGTFDLVSTITPRTPCDLIASGRYPGASDWVSLGWVSLGDNRAAAHLSAADVLGRPL